MPLSVAEYVEGLAFFALAVGPALAAAGLVVLRRLRHLGAVDGLLAFVILATLAIIAIHLLPGLVGLLSRAAAVVCGWLLLAGALLLSPRPRTADPPQRPLPQSGRTSWALAALAAVALLAWMAAAAWTGTATPSSDIDTLTFHLPNVASWIQTGSFWQVDQFTPLLANGNYPQNGDVVFLAAVMPFENDVFVRAVGIPFALAAGLAVYSLAVETGAHRATAVLLGALFATFPAHVFAATEGAKTDSVMLATFGAGLVFLLRHFRTGRWSDLALAGLGLGIAFGTKWYGVSSVLVTLAVWAAVWLWARRPLPALARNLAVLVFLITAAGGFWLVRNWIESDNPVFPAELAAFGITLFDAPRDFIRECGGFTVFGYLTEPSVWRRYILPDYRDNYGLPGALVAAGSLLALVLVARGAWRRRPPFSRSAALPLFLLVLAAGLALAYSVTPYSAFGSEGRPELTGANTRWLLPAFLAACAVAAWAAGRLGRWRHAFELAVLVAVADGLRRGFDEPSATVAAAAGALGVVAGTGYVGIRLVRAGVPRAPLAFAAAAVVAIGLAVAGYNRQRAFNDDRYLGGDPVISSLAAQRGPITVGLAGVWSVEGLSPVLPAFGPRLDNEVRFVGRFVRGQLREYETRGAFLDAVRRGGYDLLVVGKGGYSGCEVPGADSDEDAWARAAGFTPVAESDRLALYRVPGRG